MPKSFEAENEGDFKSKLKKVVQHPHVQRLIDMGATSCVTVVEISDIVENDNTNLVVYSPFSTARDLILHKTMVELGALCSAASKTGVMCCWKYGGNRAAAINFDVNELILTSGLPRYMNVMSNRFMVKGVPETIGHPYLSMGASITRPGTAKSVVLNQILVSTDVALTRVDKAKEMGRNQIVRSNEVK